MSKAIETLTAALKNKSHKVEWPVTGNLLLDGRELSGNLVDYVLQSFGGDYSAAAEYLGEYADAHRGEAVTTEDDIRALEDAQALED